MCFTSAVRGEGLVDLFATIDEVADAARHRVPPGEVTALVREAIERRPITIRGVPLTLQAAAQVGIEPPTFALRVNRPDEIHFSYERYLVKSLRRVFGFTGSPIRLSLRKAAGQGADALATAQRDAAKEGAAALGFTSAVAAIGAFFIPKSFGSSIALTGGATAALIGFVVFYVTCLALTWWYYTRRNAEVRLTGAGSKAAEPAAATTAQ